jgi:hypothetical protein
LLQPCWELILLHFLQEFFSLWVCHKLAGKRTLNSLDVTPRILWRGVSFAAYWCSSGPSFLLVEGYRTSECASFDTLHLSWWDSKGMIYFRYWGGEIII